MYQNSPFIEITLATTFCGEGDFYMRVFDTASYFIRQEAVFYLTIVIVLAFTFFSFIGIFESG